ncbi:MAG: hypothetical protein NZ853_04225 [Leptospiraceae bacterium]|nr:hypothetical protein [Leptospiraceae bacterium]MDW7975380.1 hypothetical protein [Leptospiraceae bacterium]
MIQKLVGIKDKVLFLLLIFIGAACYTPPIRKIPEFYYQPLLQKHYKEKFHEPFPIVVQPFEEETFFVSDDGYLIFASNDAGNLDLWLRDLNTVLQLKIIEHPAKQTRPYLKKIHEDLYLLLFVSYNDDINGDIYFTYINPKEIFEAYITRRIRLNYWQYSQNLSKFIDDYFSSDSKCKGKYVEDFPFVVENQDYIYFLSNRCSDGYYLWRISFDLEDGKVRQKPEKALPIPLYYPTHQKGKILFNKMQGQQILSEFGIWDVSTNQILSITPRFFEKPIDGLAIKPSLHPQKNQIYFIHIPRDTNLNQSFDPYDNSTILKMSFDGLVISQVLPDDKNITELQISSYIQDSIFYISNHYRQKDIFLTFSEGNIPKLSSPFLQYDFALQNQNHHSYPLILQSVLNYDTNHPEFLVIEGEVIFDLMEFYSKQKDKQKLEYFEQYFKNRISQNPLIEIFYQLRSYETQKALGKLQNLEEEFLKKNPDSFTKNYFYFRLGNIYLRQNKNLAFSYFQKVEPSFVKFPFVQFEVIKENLQTQKYLNSNESYLETLSKFPSLLVSYSEALLDELDKKSLSQLLDLQQKAPTEELKYYISYSIAQKYFLQNEYTKALETLKLLTNLQKPHYKYLNLLILRQKILIYKKLGLEKELLEARYSFINAYDKNLNIELGEDEIEGLISSSYEYVMKYRKAAKLIYEAIENEFIKGFQLLQTPLVSLTAIDKDNLDEFCAPDSLAGQLIDSYDYVEYERRYENLCRTYRNEYQNQNQIPIELAFETNQLMYLSSYAYANMINLLFISVHLSGSFRDYYQKWSVFYHRLKIDLSVERFRYLIDWEEKRALFLTQKEITNLLVEKDPFAGTIFNDLLYGYREIAFKGSLQNFDYSVLYGHAYTLIRKSIERENYYDYLFRKGYSISNEEMIRRKREILLELKEAEYILQYIMILDPTNEDATLLLSYLYSYIDYRKEASILNPPGYVDRVFRYLTGIRPKKQTDGIFYQDLYANTFPERLFEKNITLLESLIEIQNLSNKKTSPEVFLNLGLNYYIVRNYKKAIENFEKVQETIWDYQDFQTKALFYFYFAKAYFFEDEYLKAISYLDKSYTLFDSIYQEKLKNYNATISKLEPQKVTLPLLRNNLKTKFDQEIQYWRDILLVLKTYKTLIYFYGKDYTNAIDELQQIIEDIQTEDAVKVYNIYNLLALNSLNNLDLSGALRFSEEAMKETLKVGLKRNDEIFIPQTVGGRLISLFMKFGEDFAIIGDSRMPYEIPSLRSYLISLGIQRNSYSELKDVDSLLKVIQEKKETIKKYDYDVRLGKEAYIALLNQEGYIYKQLLDYERSYKAFQEAYELAYKFQFTTDYYKNFKNSFYVIFEELEHQDLNEESARKEAIRKIEQLKEKLDKFKSDYYQIRKAEYEKARRIENPDYEFTERDDEIIKEQVEIELLEFYHIRALLLYYEGLTKKDENIFFASLQEFERLIQSYKKLEMDRLYFRIHVNYFKTYVQYTNIKNQPIPNEFLEKINALYIEITGLDLPTETIEILKIYGDVFYYQKNCKQAANYYERIIAYLDSNLNLLYIENPWILDDFYYKYTYCLLQLKDYQKIVVFREKYRFYLLHNYFLSSKLQFPDKNITSIFSSWIRVIEIIRNLKQLEIQERLQEKNVKILKEQIQKHYKIYQILKEKFVSYYPQFQDFLFPQRINFNQNNNPQIIFFFSYERDSCLSYYKNKFLYEELFLPSDIQKCAKEKNVVLIPDKYSYFRIKPYYDFLKGQSNVVLRSSIFETYPVHITQPDDLKTIAFKNLFNHNPNTVIPEQDYKEFTLSPLAFLMNTRSNGIGASFRSHFTASIVKIHSNKNPHFSFDSLWISYEFFHKLGASTIMDPQNLTWGILGYHQDNLKNYKKELAKKTLEKGLKLYKTSPQEALFYFSLSDSYEEDLKTKNYILGALIRTKNPLYKTYQEMLKQKIKEKGSRLEELRYYVMVLNAFSYTQDYQQIQETLKELNQIYPHKEKLQIYQNTIDILMELSKPTPNYQKVEEVIYNKQYDTSFTDILIEKLQHHALYHMANHIAGKYEVYKEDYIKNEIYINFLKLKGSFKELNSNFEDPNLKLLNNLYQNKFDLIVQTLREEYIENFQDKRYPTRIAFYEYLKNIYQDKNLNLEKFLCQNGKRNQCQDFTEIDEFVYLQFSLQNIPFDTYKVIHQNWNSLLPLIFEKSCFRGVLFLSRILSRYIQNFEYQTAFSFYQKYQNQYQCIFHKESEKYVQEILNPLLILRAMQYKIDDSFILKVVERFPKTKGIAENIIKLLFEPPENLKANLEKFPWSEIDENYHKNIYDILLKNLLKKNQIRDFQNIAFMKDTEDKNYTDKFSRIQKVLNQEEDFVSIIELDGDTYFCSIKQQECKKLNIQSLDFRLQLQRYFYEKTYFQSEYEKTELLVDFYSKIPYSHPQTRKTYLWLSGSHKEAPIPYRENLYFVFYPLDFEEKRKPFIKNEIPKFEVITESKQKRFNDLELIASFKNNAHKGKGLLLVSFFPKQSNENVLYFLLKNKKKEYELFSKPDFPVIPHKGNGILIPTWSESTGIRIFQKIFEIPSANLSQRLTMTYREFALKNNYEPYFVKPFVHSLVE